MRAVRVTRLDGPDAVEVGEVAEPAGDGVVVEVHAAGVAFPDAFGRDCCPSAFEDRRRGPL